jgi:hypothetical protein
MKKMLLSRTSVKLDVRMLGGEDLHPSHCQWRSQLQDPQPSVEALSIDLDDNIVFGTDLDLGLGTIVEFVEDLGQRSDITVSEVSGTDDGTFDGSNRDVQKVVTISPRDFGRVFVMVLTEQEAENRSQTERVQLDGNVYQGEMWFLKR